MTDKHSVTINGHRTSITLEEPFWNSLKEIAAARGKTISALVTEIDARNPENLSSALRILVLEYYKKR